MSKTKTSRLTGSLVLILCALIWGMSFVAQSLGARQVSAFAYNTARFLIATVFLLLILMIRERLAGRRPSIWGTESHAGRRALLDSGIRCGVFLTLGITFQQLGIRYTSAGKAGFVTALYIVVVPLLSLFLGKKIGVGQWGSILLALAGFFVLSVSGDLSVGRGEWIIFIGSIFLALHILAVDRLAHGIDILRLSILRFGTGTIISFGLSLVLSPGDLSPAALLPVLKPLLYSGILSSGVAHTLQVVGQKRVPGVVAALLLSLESVFSVIAGGLLLQERLASREIVGCVLVFIAIIAIQLLPQRSANRQVQAA